MLQGFSGRGLLDPCRLRLLRELCASLRPLRSFDWFLSARPPEYAAGSGLESRLDFRDAAVREKTTIQMTASEKRAVLGLAGVYGFRMLGLFLILPVFALFAERLPGATPLLTGLAVGIYGLTQAALQIPFGLLSDRIGRKPVIFGGLLLFALGSVIAASAQDVWMVIFGRAVQGSGAIAAAVMALAADLTREENRTKAMASIGITIGMSFMVAMMAGPVLGRLIGVSGIFWLTAVLALLGIALVALIVPTPDAQQRASGCRNGTRDVPARVERWRPAASRLRHLFAASDPHCIVPGSAADTAGPGA